MSSAGGLEDGGELLNDDTRVAPGWLAPLVQAAEDDPLLGACQPKLLLADEPTANLDSKTGEGLLQLMAQMNRERGVTFIFSTHDPMVIAYARRVVTIHDGRIANDRAKAA